MDWRVDYIMSSSEEAEVNKPVVQLKLGVSKDDKTAQHSFEIDHDKFSALFGGFSFHLLLTHQ